MHYLVIGLILVLTHAGAVAVGMIFKGYLVNKLNTEKQALKTTAEQKLEKI